MQLDLFTTPEGHTIIESEEWQTIPGFPRYEASTLGRFRNKGTGRYLGGTAAHNGYLHVSLVKDGKTHTKLSHRMIAETFLDQPSPKHCEVNHKNKVRSDNRLANLEWMTRQQNSLHAWAK